MDHWFGTVIVVEAVGGEEGGLGSALYFLLSFSVNLKLL